MTACDAFIGRGARAGRECGAPATHYHHSGHNRCGKHVIPGSRPGTGPAWFSDAFRAAQDAEPGSPPRAHGDYGLSSLAINVMG